MLTESQSEVVRAVERGDNVFLTGPGGVGKSTIIRRVVELFSDAKTVGVTAMTGVAALLVKGSTLHSYLCVGLARDSPRDIAKNLRRNAAVWKNTNLLIVDEISMLSAELLDKLDAVAKLVRKNDKPFGGIQLLLSGDFLQLPCVRGSFAFEGEAWPKLNLRVFYLREVMRQSDERFVSCLSNARLGRLSEEELTYVVGREDAFEANGIAPTRLFCKNVDVDAVNDREMRKLPGKRYSYELDVSPAVLNLDYTKHCNAQADVVLAVGAQVMLLVNLDQSAGLVNGSRGVVTSFADGFPVVRFRLETRAIHHHGWEVKKDKKLLTTIYQIPLRLAYALTIHKSQGCTLDSALIDLDGVFECGQAYVAVSRCKSVDCLRVVNASTRSFVADVKALAYYEKIVRT